VVFISFAILVFVLKSSVYNSPLYWDEYGSMWRVYNVLDHKISKIWKPPFLYLLVGLGYKIFGYSLILPRFLISIFGLLALYFTYLSGERLYNSTIGLLSSLLLFLSPIFFAQCGLFHDVIPLTFFTISTFFYYISKSRLKFVFFSIGLILIKEVGIVVIISMLLVEIVKFVLGKEVKIKDVSCLFPSLVIFCIWIYLNKIKKHYFIRPDYIKWYLDAPFSPKFLWITFYNFFMKGDHILMGHI